MYVCLLRLLLMCASSRHGIGLAARYKQCLKVCWLRRQWSWPINFPLPLLGIFNSKELVNGDTSPPWSDELEFKSFSEFIGIAPYCETAFFHKPTKTLLVTDAVVFIPNEPPEVQEHNTHWNGLLSALRCGPSWL